MTQTDRQLLLADLCARLPYGVFVDYNYNAFDVHNGNYVKHGLKCILKCYLLDVFMSPRQNEKGEYIKPYLRPMSSMTEKEKDEMFGICTLSNCSVNSNWEFVGVEIMSSHPRYGDYYSKDYSVIDWLNKNMFDYRGLIPKGLALEAPKGMYKEEQQ